MRIYTSCRIWGNKVFYRGYDIDGDTYTRFDDTDYEYQPTMFVTANQPTEFKTMSGDYVEMVKPGSLKDCREFIKKYENVDNFRVWGNERFVYQYISDNYRDVPITTTSKNLSVGTIDIECDGGDFGFPNVADPQYRIPLITIRKGDIRYVIGIGYFESTSQDIIYKECVDEVELLTEFLNIWASLDFDIVSGWNVKIFDIPYLVNRIEKVLGEGHSKALSPYGHVNEDVVKMNGREYLVFDIVGVSILDYIDLYKKFILTRRESYKLDNIAYEELGEKKISYEEHGSLMNLLKNDWKKFVEYNIKDVDLVYRLDEKLNLIDLAVSLAYMTLVNYDDVFSPVRMWDSLLYNKLKALNIVIPMSKVGEKDHEIVGAYVKEPQIGVHKWLMTFDEASLYPSIISSLNLSPDTLVEDEHADDVNIESLLQRTNNLQKYYDKNYVVAANGSLYRRDKRGIFPELMDWLYAERKATKSKALDFEKQVQTSTDPIEKIRLEKERSRASTREKAIKVVLNAGYGTCSSKYFRFYENRIAEAVTTTGQVIIQWLQRFFDNHFNQLYGTSKQTYVDYVDTDAIYLNMDQMVSRVCKDKSRDEILKFLLKVGEKQLQPMIEEQHVALGKYLNVHKQNLKMKLEVVADKSIFIAKKRYIMSMLYKEGIFFKTPKLKIMGLEVVRSSTPNICRKKLKDAISIIVNGTQDEVVDFVKKVREEFIKSPPEIVAFPRTCSGLEKYADPNKIYRKEKGQGGTPIAVRGGLLYNHYLKEMNLESKYHVIGEGDKIKFVYLKMPNRIGENIISFPDEHLPDELGLSGMIDYDLQFEKSFVGPIKNILVAAGMTLEEHVSLEEFFA